MRKLFSKKEVFKVKSIPYDPESMAEPMDADGFIQRGTAFYARKDYSSAINDLNRATAIDGNKIDSFYALGMAYKATQENEKSVSAFRQVLELIKHQADADKVRNAMLRRLALGHINEITQGDWNLEKEIWQRTT
jgi:Tfp pilus assembly protein PilF